MVRKKSLHFLCEEVKERMQQLKVDVDQITERVIRNNGDLFEHIGFYGQLELINKELDKIENSQEENHG